MPAHMGGLLPHLAVLPGKVALSVMALRYSSKFYPRCLPNLAILSFPFPKQKKLRPCSMNLLNGLPHIPQTYLQPFLLLNSAEDQCKAVQSLCPDPTCHLSELASLFYNFILCSSAGPVPSAYGHIQISSVKPKQTKNSPSSFSRL